MKIVPRTLGLLAVLLAAGATASGPAAAVAFYTFEGATLTNKGVIGMPPLVPTGSRVSGFFEFEQPLPLLSSSPISLSDPRLLDFDFSYAGEHWRKSTVGATGSLRLSTDNIGNPLSWNFGIDKPSLTDPNHVFNVSVAGGIGEGPYNYVTYASTVDPSGQTVGAFRPGSLCLASRITQVNCALRSNASWRTTDSFSQGWQGVGFEDSGWGFARAPYPNAVTTPQDIVPGTSAELMWHWNGNGTPTGSDGPNVAYFRYDFAVNLAGASTPLLAGAKVMADDVFQMYVNGTLVTSASLDANKGANGQPRPVFVDFSPYLRDGDNVIAIKAWDGYLLPPADGGPIERDRGFEWVFFDGMVRSVPEPSSAALLGSGMGLMAARALLSRRRKAAVATCR